MLLVMRSILETGEVQPLHFAHCLKEWIAHGFPQLGDDAGCGMYTAVPNEENNQAQAADRL